MLVGPPGGLSGLIVLPAHRHCRHTPLDPRRFHVRTTSASTLAVSGDVDVATAPALEAALDRTSIVCVDLAGVSFMDAAGLAVLLRAHRDRVGGLSVRAPSRCVARLLALTGHDATLHVAVRHRAQRSA